MAPNLLANPLANLPSYNPFTLLRMGGFTQSNNFTLDQVPTLAGKVAVITGGSAGIGREIVAQLLLRDIPKVYIIGRTQANYDAAKDEWATMKGLKKEDIESRTEFIQCDLIDIEQVHKAAVQLRSKLDRLDMLFNNASISLTSFSLSPQGIESTFAANHLGHYILTLILLPILTQTAWGYGDARVVNTSSSVHMIVQSLDLNLLTQPSGLQPQVLDAFWRYGRTKLANILFTKELASRLDKMGVENLYLNAFFPGNIPTDAMETWKAYFGNLVGGAFKTVFGVVGQSVEDGAATALYLAAGEGVKEGNVKGRYFVPVGKEEGTSLLAEGKDLRKNLWYWSDHKVGEVLGKRWQEE